MIYIPAEDWQRGAFRAWMRTGIWPNTPPAGLFSVKYNHWHDTEDGRFTFSGSGRHDGTPSRSIRAGGGSFGGGGATGEWEGPGGFGGGGGSGGTLGPTIREPGKPSTPPAIQPGLATPAIVAADRSQSPRFTPAPNPYRLVIRNGYEFRIDSTGRTRQISGQLTGGAEPRSRSVQARAGVPDRLPTDDGGHYIAPRFNGPAEAFNHFAQDSNFNRGRYRAIEDEWNRAKRLGKRVTVRIVPFYEGTSKRPATIDVYWMVGEREYSQKIPNAKQGKSNVGR